jgi:hypothetical protein
MSNIDERVGSSFRDPSGFLFKRNGVLYRQVNQSYSHEYEKLMTGGLFDLLTSSGMLTRHVEVDIAPFDPIHAYKIIQPQIVPFISYPYEWSFSMLKDAALLTLFITRSALENGMILKDASAYNIQFLDGKPILIDKLSFSIYKDGSLWEGYRQFCQHFLAPLALAALVDESLLKLLRIYIDGIPLDLASNLLPLKTRFPFSGLGMHIHMHAGAQKKYAASGATATRGIGLSKAGLLNVISSLEKTVKMLQWTLKGTEWGDYYAATNYSSNSLRAKGKIVSRFIDIAAPSTAWDLGANNGIFSREASLKGIMTVASDIDPAAVEQNYLAIKAHHEKNLLPLVIDLTNPSPAIGWAHCERDSLLERGPVDMVLALALIHHIAISNNVPLDLLAIFMAQIGRWAIVEFVPKSDSQVQRLLSTRKDIFDEYTKEGFEEVFGRYFTVETKTLIPGTQRTLYLLRNQSVI